MAILPLHYHLYYLVKTCASSCCTNRLRTSRITLNYLGQPFSRAFTCQYIRVPGHAAIWMVESSQWHPCSLAHFNTSRWPCGCIRTGVYGPGTIILGWCKKMNWETARHPRSLQGLLRLWWRQRRNIGRSCGARKAGGCSLRHSPFPSSRWSFWK